MKPISVCRLDFWEIYELRAADHMFVIPVNGTIKKNGDAVMGRGLALDVARRYPFLPTTFGHMLKQRPNVVREFKSHQLLLFPVKYRWQDDADLGLIASSCRQISLLSKFWKYKMIYLPHVGCGNGGLHWETLVKPVVERHMSVPYVIIQPR